MSYFLIIGGTILVVASARNTQGDLFTLLKNDLVNTNGPTNFLYWYGAILGVGAVGYIPRLQPISDAFLVLIIIVLFIHNSGFFAQLQKALPQIKSQSTGAIGNASSPGVSIAVDTVPSGGNSVSSTTVAVGGTVGGSGGPIGGGNGGQQCPPGYEWLDSQCVPIIFGGGGDPFPIGGGGDPFPGDPGDQGDEGLLRRLPVLRTSHSGA